MIYARYSTRNILAVCFLVFLLALIAFFANSTFSAQEEYSIGSYKYFDNKQGLEELDTTSYEVIHAENLDFGFTKENIWLGFDIKEGYSADEIGRASCRERV